MRYLMMTLWSMTIFLILAACGLAAGGGPLAICSAAQPKPKVAPWPVTPWSTEREIREYQGKRLDPFDRAYDNSIRGPQRVDIKAYRLQITGLVHVQQSLTYPEVLRLPMVKRAITLYCVEGWNEHLLFEGVRLADLLALARPKKGVRFIIFYAADGYSSSLSYDYAIRHDIMLAARINGRVLDAKRGFPFQVVAESKLGYKWVKWVMRIELSDKPYKGYWEQRGYDNEADVK